MYRWFDIKGWLIFLFGGESVIKINKFERGKFMLAGYYFVLAEGFIEKNAKFPIHWHDYFEIEIIKRLIWRKELIEMICLFKGLWSTFTRILGKILL